MKKAIKKVQKKAPKKNLNKLRAKGVSKVAIIAVVAVVLVGAGAYFVLGQKGGSVSKALPFVKAPLNANCKHNDPDLCKFLNNWQTQSNYTVTTVAKAEGFTMESLYQISGENKFRMVSKQNGKETSNMISIGDTTYTLDYTDNKWWKYTSKPEETEASPEEEAKEQFDFNAEEVEDKTSYKFVAKEACGDLTCFKYEMVDPESSEYKQFIYFDDKDYLTRKMRMEGAKGEAHESVFSYDSVDISEPSPVKEGTPNSGANAGYSEEEMNKMMEKYKEQAPLDNEAMYGNEEPPVEDYTSDGY